MSVDDKYRLVCFLKFEDDRLPEVYIIPATAWQNQMQYLWIENMINRGRKVSQNGELVIQLRIRN